MIDCGLPEGSFIDLGTIPNDQTPGYLAAANVALFPNRCEPGTNLVAMEAMATGVPCIISANTGHLDIIREDNCLALTTQHPVEPIAPFTGAEGWGESSVDEILSALEITYSEQDRVRQIGMAGAATMEEFSWSAQSKQLIDVIEDLKVN